MNRPNRAWALAAPIFLLAACRSPLAPGPRVDEGPEAWRVGRGVHGWPIYERDPETDGWRTDVLWPAASIRTTESGGLRQADILWPVLHYTSEEGRLRYGVRPLFDWLREEPEEPGTRGVQDLDLLFPIVKWREAPLEKKFEIRPLFFTWDEPESKGTTLFPLYWRKEGADSSYLHFWPSYGVDRRGTFRKQWVLAPFFSRAEDPAEGRLE